MGGTRKRGTSHNGPFTDNETVAPFSLGGQFLERRVARVMRVGGRGKKGSVLCNKVDEGKSVLLQAADGVQDIGRQSSHCQTERNL